MTERTFRVEAVAWLACLVPLVVVHAAYLISASAELVPWCMPYLEGCTSISRAARQQPAIYLFRATMLPYTALLMLYWWLAAQWLSQFAPDRQLTRRWMLGLGLIGAAFLALYATFLGIEGEVQRWLRRYGINVYFSFSVLAQMLLMSAVFRDVRLPRGLRDGLLGLCLAMLVLGLLSLPLQFLVADRDASLNALEWIYSVLMVSFYALTALAWRRTGFRVQVRLGA